MQTASQKAEFREALDASIALFERKVAFRDATSLPEPTVVCSRCSRVFHDVEELGKHVGFVHRRRRRGMVVNVGRGARTAANAPRSDSAPPPFSDDAGTPGRVLLPTIIISPPTPPPDYGTISPGPINPPPYTTHPHTPPPYRILLPLPPTHRRPLHGPSSRTLHSALQLWSSTTHT